MNSDNQSNQPTSAVGQRERCLSYLLGEMTDQQCRAFESELADPDLAEALLRESELLCRVATSAATEAASAPRLASAIGPAASLDPAPSGRWRNHRSTIRSFAPIASVLAAAVLILVGYTAYSLNTPTRSVVTTRSVDRLLSPAAFQLEVAKTWVQPAVEWVPGDQVDPDLLSSDTLPDAFDDSEFDETFDWMMTAVEATMQVGQGRNDG